MTEYPDEVIVEQALLVSACDYDGACEFECNRTDPNFDYTKDCVRHLGRLALARILADRDALKILLDLERVENATQQREMEEIEQHLSSFRHTPDQKLSDVARTAYLTANAEADIATQYGRQVGQLAEIVRSYDVACTTMESEGVFEVMSNGAVYSAMVAEARAAQERLSSE